MPAWDLFLWTAEQIKSRCCSLSLWGAEHSGHISERNDPGNGYLFPSPPLDKRKEAIVLKQAWMLKCSAWRFLERFLLRFLLRDFLLRFFWDFFERFFLRFLLRDFCWEILLRFCLEIFFFKFGFGLVWFSCIPSFNLLLCLELVKKFVVVVGGWWCVNQL